jgi:hypothetical protein
MERFARVVLGYHGCLEPVASRLLTGETSIAQWVPSQNDYDWLGHGIYFWEHSPARAMQWAKEQADRHNGRRAVGAPAVVGAVIQLGACLDLTDVRHTQLLATAYEQVWEAYRAEGRRLPRNTGGDQDLKKRQLDCLVINWLHQHSGAPFQTVRGAFPEGDPVYPGAKIMRETHIQIAVRDKACILGIFRPTM